MSDPSLLVTNPTRTDPTLAPAGRQAYYVLAPTPNLDAGIDWAGTGPRYRDELVAVLEARGYVGFGDGDRGRAAGHAGRLGGVRAWPRAHRSRPRTRSPRPGRSGRRPRPRAGQRGLRRLGHPARGRRADGAAVRPAGRRADHRPRRR